MSRMWAKSSAAMEPSSGVLRRDLFAGGAFASPTRDARRFPRAYARVQPVLVVLCTYACAENAPGHAGRSWQRAVELTRAGHDVWVVTSSKCRPGIEGSLARLGLPNLRFVYWDLPGVMAHLEHWGWSRHLHRMLWYRHVQQAIGDWHIALGMHIVRRFVHRARWSVTYLSVPCTFVALGNRSMQRTPR